MGRTKYAYAWHIVSGASKEHSADASCGATTAPGQVPSLPAAWTFPRPPQEENERTEQVRAGRSAAAVAEQLRVGRSCEAVAELGGGGGGERKVEGKVERKGEGKGTSAVPKRTMRGDWGGGAVEASIGGGGKQQEKEYTCTYLEEFIDF